MPVPQCPAGKRGVEMKLPNVRRTLAVLTLTAFLVPGSAAGADSGNAQPTVSLSSLCGQLWDWMTALLQLPPGEDDGNRGQSTPIPPPGGVDQGPGIDPNGG